MPLDTFCEIRVDGQAEPAGSKTAMPVYRGKKGAKELVLTEDGRPIMNIVHDNPRTEPWMEAVALQARASYKGRPVDGPVIVEIHCYEARPKSHYRSGRNSHLLKPEAPAYPHSTTTGDSGKLRRAIEDALTGIVWVDDKRVVQGHDCKWYIARGQQPFALIKVAHMEHATVTDLAEAGLLDADAIAAPSEGQLAMAA